MQKYGLKIGIFIILAVVLSLSLVLFNGGFERKEVKAEYYYESDTDYSNWYVPIPIDSLTYTIPNTQRTYTYNWTYSYYDIYKRQLVNATKINLILFTNGRVSLANPDFSDHNLYEYYGYVTPPSASTAIGFLIANSIPTSQNGLLLQIFHPFKTTFDLTTISGITSFNDWWNSTPSDLKTILTDIGIPTWNEYDSQTELGSPANNPPIEFSDIQKGVDGLNMVISEQERVIYQQEQRIDELEALTNQFAPYMSLDIVEGLFTSLGSLFNITIGPIPLYVFLLIPIILMIIYLIFKLMR